MSDPQPPYEPYGQGQPWAAPENPAYGYGYGRPHSGASTSLVVGIVSIVVAVLGSCFCLFLGAVGVVIGPIGIYLALKARREIDAAPHLYSNRGNAVGGLVCSIVGTVLGGLVLIASVAVLVFYGAVLSNAPY